MGKWKKSTLLVAVVFVLSGTLGQAAMIELKPGDDTVVSVKEVYDLDGEKRIDVRNRKLGDVLQAVENVSGITVSINDEMVDIPVDADIRDKEWHLALQQLLKDFNIVFNFVDSKITALKVLSLHGKPDEQKSTEPSLNGQKEGVAKEMAAKSKSGKASVKGKESAVASVSDDVEKDELGRPVLVEGEYIGDTKIKIRRSYPEGFRVSVMPPTQPPGLVDNTPPPGAENTMFRPPLPTSTIKPAKDVDNTPPPGSTL